MRPSSMAPASFSLMQTYYGRRFADELDAHLETLLKRA